MNIIEPEAAINLIHAEDDRFTWLAMDADGTWTAYGDRPVKTVADDLWDIPHLDVLFKKVTEFKCMEESQLLGEDEYRWEESLISVNGRSNPPKNVFDLLRMLSDDEACRASLEFVAQYCANRDGSLFTHRDESYWTDMYRSMKIHAQLSNDVDDWIKRYGYWHPVADRKQRVGDIYKSANAGISSLWVLASDDTVIYFGTSCVVDPGLNWAKLETHTDTFKYIGHCDPEYIAKILAESIPESVSDE